MSATILLAAFVGPIMLAVTLAGFFSQ